MGLSLELIRLILTGVDIGVIIGVMRNIDDGGVILKYLLGEIVIFLRLLVCRILFDGVWVQDGVAMVVDILRLVGLGLCLGLIQVVVRTGGLGVILALLEGLVER